MCLVVSDSSASVKHICHTLQRIRTSSVVEFDWLSLMCNFHHIKCLCFSAIQYYRKAVQLVPDIEFKIDEFRPIRRGK